MYRVNCEVIRVPTKESAENHFSEIHRKTERGGEVKVKVNKTGCQVQGNHDEDRYLVH